MAKRIQTTGGSAALAIVLVLALAACGGSRTASGAAGASDQTRSADKEYCTQRPICFQPGFADGVEGTTTQAQPSHCSADGAACIEEW
jgi:ABC-type glycerol-3-phosphate transport system substrate-binding protein